MSAKKPGKKQEKDSTVLDMVEKFAIENRDIPRLQQIIQDYLSKNRSLRNRYAEIKELLFTTIEENVDYFLGLTDNRLVEENSDPVPEGQRGEARGIRPIAEELRGVEGAKREEAGPV